ncbi:hypothetical protein [Acinetobacter venetianus]|uniref:hypothetical protein n=1 Tax=Acinetobacter venetianus TaxID=52133 RepID=UPI003A8D7501
MNLIKPLLSGLLIVSLSACSPPSKPESTSETTTAQSSEAEASSSTTENPADDKFKTTMVNSSEYDLNDPPVEPVQAAPQEQFEVRVRREESQYSMTGYTDLLNIMSLNDAPTTITGVLINRGNCRSKGTYDYQNMRYGSVAKVYLGCSAEYVREVTITTSSGLTYTYNF